MKSRLSASMCGAFVAVFVLALGLRPFAQTGSTAVSGLTADQKALKIEAAGPNSSRLTLLLQDGSQVTIDAASFIIATTDNGLRITTNGKGTLSATGTRQVSVVGEVLELTLTRDGISSMRADLATIVRK